MLIPQLAQAQKKFQPDPIHERLHGHSMRSNVPIATPQADSNLTVLGRWAWGSCEAVDAQGTYAYIGNGATFHVLDVSGPSSPRIVGEYLTDGYVSDVRVRDTLAFLASVKLLILDVSDPMAPTMVSDLDIPGIAFRVFLADSFVYVTTLSGAMFVVDISNPTSPTLRGGIAAGGMYTRSVAARERYVYVGNEEWWDAAIIDARNPDSLSRTFLGTSGFVFGLSVQDTILLVGVNGTLKLYSVSMPASPVYLGGVTLPDWILGITPAGSTAYVITSDSGVYAIDISDLSQPQVRSRLRRALRTQMGVYNGVLTGQNMVVPYSIGVAVLDVSQPDSLRQESFFPTGGSAVRVAIKDSLVYVASGAAGLWILDISNPEQPRSVSNVNTEGITTDVVVTDSFAYLVNSDVYWMDGSTRGLWVVDLSDSSHPHIVSHHVGIVRSSSPVHSNTLAKQGNWIFVAQSARGDSILEIVDVANPYQPIQLGAFYADYPAYFVDVKDSIAYVASPDSGLIVIDVSNPTSPVRIRNVLNYALGLTVRDSFLFVMADSFYVFDISDPRNPFQIGTANRSLYGATSFDMTSSGNFVYWAENSLGGIDISDPIRPVERLGFSGYEWINDVVASGNTVVAADGGQGVWVLRNNLLTSAEDQKRHSFPESFDLYQNYPNPFNAQTVIEFFVPQRGLVTLEAYNVLGQKVATLFSGTAERGEHKIILDASGLSSGLYFYRAAGKEGSVTRKMILLK